MPLRPRHSRLQGLARGDAELLADDVDPGDELGDRMLDLDPAVQLEQVEVAAVEHELDRARAAIAERRPEGDRGVAHARAQVAVERGGGRLLEHLLVAALDRALALAEGEDRPVPVGQELDLDVTRTLDVALAVDAVVAEGGLGLSLRGVHRVPELGRVADDAHAAPAASRRGLDDEREADVVRVAGGQRRNARLDRDPLRLELVAARAEGLGSRADEHEDLPPRRPRRTPAFSARKP